MADLLTNATTDTEGSSVPWSGGVATFFVRGVLRRPTQVILQIQKHGRWVTANHRLVFSGEGQEDVVLGACDVRAKLINAQANTDVSASIEAAT